MSTINLHTTNTTTSASSSSSSDITTSSYKIGEYNEFKKWLYRNNCFLTKHNNVGKAETHLLINGGRLSVKPELEPAFLKEYAASIDRGEWIYLVEKKTNIFNMFVELDFKTSVPIPEEKIIQMSKSIQRDVICQMIHFENDDQSTMIVSFVPSVIDSKASTEETILYKTGIHLNWKFPVNVETAKIIREKLLLILPTVTASYLKPHNSWKDIIDPCIYKKNGLRLIYSRKAEPCKKCKGSPNRYTKKPIKAPVIPSTTIVDPNSLPNTINNVLYANKPTAGMDKFIDNLVFCNDCAGVGKVDLGRAYTILTKLNAKCESDEEYIYRLKTDVFFAVYNMSIRILDNNVKSLSFSNDTDPGFTDYIKVLKRYSVLSYKKYNADLKQKHTESDKTDANNGSEGMDKPIDLDMSELSEDTKQFKVISTAIKNLFSGSPVVVSVKKLNSNKQRKAEFKKEGINTFYIAHTRNHYCLNKKGEHNNSFVYYVITFQGIYQKCFSRKEIVYQPSNVTCANFKSPYKTLERSIQNILFPKSEVAALRIQRRLKAQNKLIFGNKLEDMEEGPDKEVRRAGILFMENERARHQKSGVKRITSVVRAPSSISLVSNVENSNSTVSAPLDIIDPDLTGKKNVNGDTSATSSTIHPSKIRKTNGTHEEDDQYKYNPSKSTDPLPMEDVKAIRKYRYGGKCKIRKGESDLDYVMSHLDEFVGPNCHPFRNSWSPNVPWSVTSNNIRNW
jgi:hypothetical protein